MGSVRLILALALYMALVGQNVAVAEQPATLLKAHLEPSDVVNQEAVQLLVEVQSTQLATNLRLEVTPPPGFQAKPTTPITLPSFQGHYTVPTISIQRSNGPMSIGQRTLMVRVLSGDDKASTALAETSVPFAYKSRISIPFYLFAGGLGILMGYGLRLLIKVLQAVPTPSPAPVPGPAPGPITAFVQKNYYLVDCGVTMAVGLLSLTILLKDNHVPESGLYWYSALGAGVALGLLTNSELLSKLR